MKRFKVNSVSDLNKLDDVAEIVNEDGVIAYPTDTIYGLGCNPLSEEAVEKIYTIKGRDEKRPLIILLDSASSLSKWCSVIPGKSLPLIIAWPAPLTVIFRVKPGLPDFLTRGNENLAFRVPASNLCRKLVHACGGALTSTSINTSGEKPLNTPDEIAKQFGKQIDALVEGPSLPMKASTVVTTLGGRIKVLRSGAYSLKKLQYLLRSEDEEEENEETE